MKKYLLPLIMLFVLGTHTFAQIPSTAEEKKVMTDIQPAGTPEMELEIDEHDFGTIQQGEVVTYVFTFTNTGDAPLLIEDINTPCGCTVPTYDEAPVAPGATGTIKVQFNSAGKSGMQVKTIRVHYNSVEKSPMLITIKANVNTTN